MSRQITTTMMTGTQEKLKVFLGMMVNTLMLDLQASHEDAQSLAMGFVTAEVKKAQRERWTAQITQEVAAMMRQGG